MAGTINDISIIEKKVIGYLFHDKTYIANAMNLITPQHFSSYKSTYSLIINYYMKYKDIITENMVEILFAKKNIDSNAVVEYKTIYLEVKNETFFNDGEFNALCEQLIENLKRQQFINIAQTIVNTNPIDCNSKDFTLLEDKVKSLVVKATTDKNDVKEEGAIKESARERFEKYKYVKENPESLKFIKTGLHHIDDVNGGFSPGELIYVIGRKGDGKSVLLLNFAKAMWENGNNVIIFSLEIKKADYERRFDARAAEISSNGLKMGTLTPGEEQIYKKYLQNQEKGLSMDGKKTGTLYIVDTPPGITPAFVDSKIETVETTLGIKFDVVITDYAGIMQPTLPQTEKRHQQGQIALEQKIIARQRDCIVISAAQKTRAGAKEKKSDSSFVAESDQVADHIDWGIDIASVSDDMGIIQSFKTRDAEPFNFSFKKMYNMFKIQEMEGSADAWDQLS